jgi:hypothetical protein
MMTTKDERDLVLERVVDVSPELVFKAWTTPKHLMPWFCPKPYRTVECEIDLKPGGKFFAQMVDPDGNKLPAEPGCSNRTATVAASTPPRPSIPPESTPRRTRKWDSAKAGARCLSSWSST